MFYENQIVVLYLKAKEREIPVDSMNWSTFIDYLQNAAPDLLEHACHLASTATVMVAKNAARQASLLFDGEKLYWQEFKHSSSWAGYSGRDIESKDFSIESQRNTNVGPIPEGSYLAPRTRYQERPDTIWTDMQHALGRGAWPGGASSWGNQRIWLEPDSSTETYGRSGFSIHGGTVPGSAGCIDLVENMDDFAKHFRLYGKDMPLQVDYSKHNKAKSADK